MTMHVPIYKVVKYIDILEFILVDKYGWQYMYSIKIKDYSK